MSTSQQVGLMARGSHPLLRLWLRLGLRQQLRIVFGLTIAAVLLLGGSTVVFYIYRAEQANWRSRQGEAARNAAERVIEFLAFQRQTLDLVGSLGREKMQAEPETLNKLLRQNPALIEAVYLDAAGQVIASAPEDRAVLTNLFSISQSQWFHRARAGHIYYGDLQISSQDEPYLILAVPVPGGDVIAARLDINVLWRVVAGIRFGKNGQAYVVNRRGVVIAHMDPELVLRRVDITGQPGLSRLLEANEQGWFENINGLEGEFVVSFTVPVEETDWLVITELPVMEAYTASRMALVWLLVGVQLFGIFAMKINTAYMEWLVLRPVRQLHMGAMQIEQGNLNYRIDSTGQAEIGQVADAFNQMAASLQERDAQLAAKTAGLAAEAAERQRVAEALRESEERYQLAIAGANDGLWDWDPRSNSIYYSSRWKSMLGFREDEIGNSPEEWFERVHPEEVGQVMVDLATHLEGLSPHFESEHRMQHKDGSYYWVLTRGLAVRDENGYAYRMAGSQSDITARKQAEEQLLHDAFHDALTKLPNRALFLDRLERAIGRAKRHRDFQFAVLFLDLDRFKVINDSLGHHLGDELLVAIAHRLAGCLRSGDTAARFGGDEFVILLENLKEHKDAIQVAQRIQDALKLSFTLSGHEVYTSFSIGVVLSEDDYELPAEILRDADIAMYQAKALGKARYEVFDTALRARAIARLELESELRGALERQEFQLHYQPILSLETNRITGFEALLRWMPMGKAPIPPLEFIPVAEETGLIIPIGEWVLWEACRQLREWQNDYPVEPPLTINVNISGKQFAHPQLAETIKNILDETGLEAGCLRLEITESMFMENAEFADGILGKLSALGINLQIDDFGTGYSSLSYLQRFPINTIKIDRSFTSRIGSKGDNSEIIRTIVALAREMGMDAIAEGVETAEQLSQLRALYCPYGQGYFIARPQNGEAAGALLREGVSFG